MIFVDANVPMYVVGTSDIHKRATESILSRMIVAGERLVTDAEVLQEILHRYSALRRWHAVGDAFGAILRLVDEVFAIDRRDVERARDILLDEIHLSARDAIHLAVMERHGVNRIMSFDTSFDRISGITRISS